MRTNNTISLFSFKTVLSKTDSGYCIVVRIIHKEYLENSTHDQQATDSSSAAAFVRNLNTSNRV